MAQLYNYMVLMTAIYPIMAPEPTQVSNPFPILNMTVKSTKHIDHTGFISKYGLTVPSV